MQRDTPLTMQGNPLAVRHGSWKLIPAVVPAKGKPRLAELYDLEQDLSEANNFAEARPDKVEELTKLLAELRTSGRSRQ